MGQIKKKREFSLKVLRRGEMPRLTTVLRQAKSIYDSSLLKILQSEINHELTSKPFQNDESGSLGDFAVDWDSPQSKDVIMRRQSKSGEEVAVSVLLGDEQLEGNQLYPREVWMKVCIRKPGLSSILQFDCGAYSTGVNKSDFDIYNAHYIPSLSRLDSSVYKGPSFSSLDPKLQDELKKYLIGKGIGESFTNFILLHMHKKEQGQYVNWLRRLESLVSTSE